MESMEKQRYAVVMTAVMLVACLAPFLVASGSDANVPLSIDDVAYDKGAGKISFSGHSTDDYVNIEIVNEGTTKPCMVKDGCFSGRYVVSLQDGFYELSAKGLSGTVTKRFAVGNCLEVDSVSYSGIANELTVKGLTGASRLAYQYDGSSRSVAVDIPGQNFTLVLNPDLASGAHTLAIYLSDNEQSSVTGSFIIPALTIVNTQDKLKAGDTMDLAVRSGLNPVSSDSLSWKSSDQSVATVQSGKVTAVSEGSVRITASFSENLFAYCDIIVEQSSSSPSDPGNESGNDSGSGQDPSVGDNNPLNPSNPQGGDDTNPRNDSPSNPSQQGGNEDGPSDPGQSQNTPSEGNEPSEPAQGQESNEGKNDSTTVIIIVTSDPEYILDKINEAIKDHSDQSAGEPVVVEFRLTDTEPTINMTREVVEAMLESNARMDVVSDGGSMSLSKDVMQTLSENDDVKVEFRDSAIDRMNDRQRNAVDGGATVVELKITSGDRSLGSLNGSLTVTIKHQSVPGKMPVAYYIAEDGTKEDMNGSYDPAKGEMSFITTHCSIYAVVDEDPAQEPVEEPEKVENSSDDNTMLYIGIAIAVIAAIAVAGVLYIRKN